jgi:endonuclease G
MGKSDRPRPFRVSIAGLFLSALVGTTFSLSAQAADKCTKEQQATADKELVLNTKDKNASIAAHLPWGVPKQPQGATREGLLVQRDYVIDYNADLKVPIWVAYRLDSKRLGNSSRIDCFRADPRLSDADTPLLADYDEPIFDQGHLANNADMTSSANSVINSFVLTNMAPQYCQFNEGVWQILENIVRLWAKQAQTLYVTTGSIFDANHDGKRDSDQTARRMKSTNGKQRVAIPTSFYKVIVRQAAPKSFEALTFLMPNDQTDLDGQDALAYIGGHVSRIGEVEKVTGLSLLPNAASSIKETAQTWPFTGSPGHSLVGERCRATAGNLG